MTTILERTEERAEAAPESISLKELSMEELHAIVRDKSNDHKLRIDAAGEFVQRKNAELYRRLA